MGNFGKNLNLGNEFNHSLMCVTVIYVPVKFEEKKSLSFVKQLPTKMIESNRDRQKTLTCRQIYESPSKKCP